MHGYRHAGNIVTFCIYVAITLGIRASQLATSCILIDNLSSRSTQVYSMHCS